MSKCPAQGLPQVEDSDIVGGGSGDVLQFCPFPSIEFFLSFGTSNCSGIANHAATEASM